MLSFDEIRSHVEEGEEETKLYCQKELADLREAFADRFALYPKLKNLICFRYRLGHLLGYQQDLFNLRFRGGDIAAVGLQAELKKQPPPPDYADLTQVTRYWLEWLLPEVLAHEELGRKLVADISGQLEFSAVDKLPDRLDEGFFLLPITESDREALAVYHYKLAIDSGETATFQPLLDARPVCMVEANMPPESIKKYLLIQCSHKAPQLPNPPLFVFRYREQAAVGISSEGTQLYPDPRKYSLPATLLPVVRRRLGHYLRELLRAKEEE